MIELTDKVDSVAKEISKNDEKDLALNKKLDKIMTHLSISKY